MEKRREFRTKKRLVCTLDVLGDRHTGIILDVSPRGLFVQTSAKPSPGTEIKVELTVHGASQPLWLTAVVARQKLVPQRPG